MISDINDILLAIYLATGIVLFITFTTFLVMMIKVVIRIRKEADFALYKMSIFYAKYLSFKEALKGFKDVFNNRR